MHFLSKFHKKDRSFYFITIRYQTFENITHKNGQKVKYVIEYLIKQE